MKITIAYRPGEERAAGEILAAVVQRYPRGRIRKSDRYPPVKHLYFAVKVPLEMPEALENQGVLPIQGRGMPKTGKNILTNTPDRDKITAE